MEATQVRKTGGNPAWAGLILAAYAMAVSAAIPRAGHPDDVLAAADAMPQGTPTEWAEAAARNEAAIIQQQGTFSIRYRERKVDAKGDTTRVMIESKEGGVARLVERDGKPITADEDAKERARLQDQLDHPDEFARHHHRDATNRADVEQLVLMMPKAMIDVFTPGQPQLPGIKGRQVVLDYHPNPDFHPPTLLAELLTGFEGRVWIDEASQRMVRVEGRVLKPVNFGLGLLAKIFPGGTMVLEQTPTDGGRWMYSHVEEHLEVRVALVKTIPENVRMSSSDFQMLPNLMSYQDAIRTLLAMPVTLR